MSSPSSSRAATATRPPRHARGATLVEYALLLCAVAIAAVVGFRLLGNATKHAAECTAETMSGGGGCQGANGGSANGIGAEASAAAAANGGSGGGEAANALAGAQPRQKTLGDGLRDFAGAIGESAWDLVKDTGAAALRSVVPDPSAFYAHVKHSAELAADPHTTFTDRVVDAAKATYDLSPQFAPVREFVNNGLPVLLHPKDTAEGIASAIHDSCAENGWRCAGKAVFDVAMLWSPAKAGVARAVTTARKVAETRRAAEAAEAARAAAEAAKYRPVQPLDANGKPIVRTNDRGSNEHIDTPLGRFRRGDKLEIVSKNTKLYGGNTIKLDPHATTTVTGSLDDVNTVARRGIDGNDVPNGITKMGPNPGGINILRSPRWQAIVDEENATMTRRLGRELTAGEKDVAYVRASNRFWDEVNRPWLDEAIARGDKFRFVSDPNSERALYVKRKDGSFVVIDGKRQPSIYSRELDHLREHGYTILPDGTAVKS